MENNMDGGFNPSTGEFEDNFEKSKNEFHAESPKNEKIMLTKDGKRIVVLENGTFFDPSTGEFRTDINIEDLHEDDH